MAELLAAEYSLVVVRVELSPDGATVQLSLVVNEQGHRRTAVLSDPLEISRFITTGDKGPAVRLPVELADLVTSWTTDNTTLETVLWLHLVKPYGLLGAIPWEELSIATGRRLLRLPDVLPTQSRELRALTIAVCASSPHGDVEEVLAGVDALEEVIGELEGMPITVHHFVDAAAADILSGRGDGPFRRVVHDPRTIDLTVDHGAGGGHGGRPDAAATASPWLAWLTDAARHDIFDVVHLLGHAGFGGYGEQGLLLLAASPTATREDAPQRIGSAELLHLATRTATYGLGLGSLAGNPSHDAMRTVADAVGSRRAGPVFLGADSQEGTTAVRDAYIVLFTEGGATLSPPGTTPRMLLYAQPARALQALQVNVDAQELSLAQDDAAIADLQDVLPAQAPSPSGGDEAWVDVLSSYVDQRRAEVGRLLAEQREGRLEETSKAYLKGLTDSLRSLTDLIATERSGPS